jgi:hypothetical protein
MRGTTSLIQLRHWYSPDTKQCTSGLRLHDPFRPFRTLIPSLQPQRVIGKTQELEINPTLDYSPLCHQEQPHQAPLAWSSHLGRLIRLCIQRSTHIRKFSGNQNHPRSWCFSLKDCLLEPSKDRKRPSLGWEDRHPDHDSWYFRWALEDQKVRANHEDSLATQYPRG